MKNTVLSGLLIFAMLVGSAWFPTNARPTQGLHLKPNEASGITISGNRFHAVSFGLHSANDFTKKPIRRRECHLRLQTLSHLFTTNTVATIETDIRYTGHTTVRLKLLGERPVKPFSVELLDPPRCS